MSDMVIVESTTSEKRTRKGKKAADVQAAPRENERYALVYGMDGSS